MFYLKLAVNNIRQSFKHFAPFFLVSITTFMFSSITLLIMLSKTAKTMGTGSFALGLAYIVLSIFSAIMCFYSYHFFLKQRNQEFGLYNILGMNKNQIIWLSTIELLIIYAITMLLGVVFSLIFANIFYLVFVNLIHYNNLNFSVNSIAFVINIILFSGIFFLLELVNIFKIRKTSALNLFSNQSQGEREPRGNIILALIGLLAIGYGYYLSISSAHLSALTGISRFFQAILAVILGTYLFYISFMTWYLKFRRKNKSYFYKPEHFVNTSQMIFRMKQNAVGLANITLLAIMAFVTIFSTVALYSSNNSLVNDTYPKNSRIEFIKIDKPKEAEEVINHNVVQSLKKTYPNFNKNFAQYKSASFAIPYNNQKNINVQPSFVANAYAHLDKVASIEVITQKDFRKLGNKLPKLSKGQVAFYDYNQNKSFSFSGINWLGRYYKKGYTIKKVKNVALSNMGIPAGILIVSDEQTLADMLTVYNKNTQRKVSYNYKAFADLSNKEQKVLTDFFTKNKGQFTKQGHTIYTNFTTAKEFREEGLKMTGGFLFTGFLLGIAFLLGAALIIYYKQLSEGTQDKRSYQILQEVGMSLKQVKKTINSQIVLVFFMPLILAIMHFLFALPILKKLLLNFGVQGDRFIYTVSVLTILGILIIYFIIYKVTSRTYYKIIER
ncbi:ABC transporter permease [Streptococcus macacae]|uniref:Efflux ABC transporter, permease protein n=1 Tax=Streptococcus macacae NCTC 11558 TaxID=764298 RepID=G5JU92_9STRE|nr:ABC transporter permease [Streptococcus macacae]EHJ52236.1 efflux ABC transporter, permease protein [Streptococcus macacae NCTC 11558]SUN78455.1 ABC transporter permease [Streptococcus macacae NCTC 11558]